MKKMFLEMKQALSRGESVVLCSVIASSGSVPRGAGAKMAVFADGHASGTIGGGAVEYHALQLALQVHETKTSVMKGFLLTPNQVADIGMICGGNVTVYFQYFNAADARSLALTEHILHCMDEIRDAWLITEIREKAACTTAVYDEKNGLCFGTPINEAVLPQLLRRRAVLHDDGERKLYAEPLCQSAVVYVFGGGHVSRELVPMLTHVGFRVVLCESRAEFATEKLFPDASRIVCCEYEAFEEQFAVTENDYIVILTPGHQADLAVLRRVLKTKASYIGCIGSRKKVAATREKLLKDGFSEQDIGRIHSPIGLEILAETPAEIAVSITAQLIRHRAEEK